MTMKLRASSTDLPRPRPRGARWFLRLSASALLCSCVVPEERDALTQRAKSVVSKFVDAGYAPTDIEFDAGIAKVIVQQDVAIDVDDEPGRQNGAAFRHYQFSSIAISDKLTDVRVGLDHSLREKMEEPAQKAVRAWQELGLRLNFSYVEDELCGSSTAGNIWIEQADEDDEEHLCGDGVYAVTDLKTADGYSPAGSIVICERALSNSPLQNKVILMHEIGHALGFAHTDWEKRESCVGQENGEVAEGKVHIDGTPKGFVERSVMNACPLDGPNPNKGEFLAIDELAFRAVFGPDE
ncbi:MAG: M57 family metalloprotease [Myxococcota bacterium]